MDITEVTEEMIDRVMPPEDDGYTSCPLCDYTGHWNCTMGTREDQRRRVRELLEQALGLTPNVELRDAPPIGGASLSNAGFGVAASPEKGA